MKKRRVYIFFEIIISVLFASCTGFFDLGEEKIVNLTPANQQAKTVIYFNNTNSYAVDVFSSSFRESKVVSVSANQSSSEFSWIPTNDGFEFYFTYRLPVSGIEVQYIPRKYGVDYITVSIPKDKITKIRIPKLSEIIPINEKLFDEAFIAIKNNNASAIQLLSGSSIEVPVTGSSLVNWGETALYKLNPTNNVNIYSIKIQGNSVPLYSSTITELLSGYLYEIEVKTGSEISLTRSKLLTLNSL